MEGSRMEHLTKKEARAVIVEEISPRVVSLGFRASGDRFSRKISAGKQGFSIAIFDYRPTFEFTVSVTVRIDAVEEFVAPFIGVQPKDRAITVTSLTQLEHFGLRADPGRFVLFRGSDADTIRASAVDLANVVERHVVPFLDRNQDLASIAAGLNPPGAEAITSPIFPDDRSRFDGSVEPYRAIRGVATAYLVGDPRLPELIKAYRGQLTGMVDPIRAPFESFVAHLEGLRLG